MSEWNKFHRNTILPAMREKTKVERKEVNILLSDMKSSLKWCRLQQCETILRELKKLINKSNHK